jgi:hypothetical protein
LSKTEEAFAKSLGEIENTTTEFKKDIKNFFLDSVKEVEVFSPSQQKVLNFPKFPLIISLVKERDPGDRSLRLPQNPCPSSKIPNFRTGTQDQIASFLHNKTQNRLQMDNGQQDPNPPPIAHPDLSVREHSGRSLRARSHHRQEDQMQVGWKQSPQSAPR